jgi:hypothetical protein
MSTQTPRASIRLIDGSVAPARRARGPVNARTYGASRQNSGGGRRGKRKPRPATERSSAIGVRDGDRWLTHGLQEVVYFFRGSIATGGRVASGCSLPCSPSTNPAYARIVDGGTFPTGFKSLRELQEVLDPEQFVVIFRGVIANIARIKCLHLTERLVGVRVGGTIEYLPVSKENVPVLKKIFRIPTRQGSRKKKRPRGGDAGTE